MSLVLDSQVTDFHTSAIELKRRSAESKTPPWSYLANDENG